MNRQHSEAGAAAKGVPNVAAVRNRCIAAGNRLSYPSQDGDKGNPGLHVGFPSTSDGLRGGLIRLERRCVSCQSIGLAPSSTRQALLLGRIHSIDLDKRR